MREVALWMGRIDGIRKAFDERLPQRYRAPSEEVWRQINRGHVARLTAAAE